MKKHGDLTSKSDDLSHKYVLRPVLTWIIGDLSNTCDDLSNEHGDVSDKHASLGHGMMDF